MIVLAQTDFNGCQSHRNPDRQRSEIQCRWTSKCGQRQKAEDHEVLFRDPQAKISNHFMKKSGTTFQRLTEIRVKWRDDDAMYRGLHVTQVLVHPTGKQAPNHYNAFVSIHLLPIKCLPSFLIYFHAACSTKPVILFVNVYLKNSIPTDKLLYFLLSQQSWLLRLLAVSLS